MLTELQIREQMGERLLIAQSPWGRARLRFQVHWKRWSWNVVTGVAHFLKRLFDILVSLAALVFLSPVYLVIAGLVKMDGGPVFFRQTRYGLHGRAFLMLKFRSMVVDAESRLKELLARNEKAEGITFKMKDDPRITRVGRILRKTSLDELPQFWNVLKGEMSIVGPRPPVRREVELYEQRHRRRFNAKPGITCLWQVGERHGGLFEIGDRNTIDFEEQVGLDVRYIESQSFAKDLWLLLKTVPAILFGKGA
ncbi:MAG: sugar transferase [Verrucomicrobiales bacterium]|nr:sugar transferase [Verrucomicrobiales bacterium]MCP5526673.1 sugar transferase [Verrucomicrobiales bacterium]